MQDTSVLIRGRWEGQNKKDVTTEAEVGTIGFEDGKRGHKPRIAGDPWKLEIDSLLNPAEGTQLC